MRPNHNIHTEPMLYIFLCLLLLTVPLRWLLAALLSATFHEFCHLLAIRLFGLRVFSFRIGIHGTQIQTEPMSRTQELFCAIAGPAGNVILIVFARWLPLTALFSGVHLLYNLIPIYPSDGSRILSSCLVLLFGESTGQRLYRIVEILALSLVLLLGLYLTIRLSFGILPAIAITASALRRVHLKNPLQITPAKSTIRQ